MHVLNFNCKLHLNFFSIFHLILYTHCLVSVAYLDVEKYKYFSKANPHTHTHTRTHAHTNVHARTIAHAPTYFDKNG
jgi:hypothetical protein